MKIRPCLVAAVIAALGAIDGHAASFTWAGGGSGNMLKGTTNWTNSGGPPGAGDTAVFNSAASGGTAQTLDYAFSSGTPSAAMGALFDQTLPNALSITGTKSTIAGMLTLDGQTINGLANTIFANSSGQTFTFSNTNSGSFPMTLSLGNTPNIIQSFGSGGNIVIGTNIVETSPASSITYLGGGSSSTPGATLELGLGGTSSFTGGITAGDVTGTNAGTVQIDAPSSLPSTGSIVVNANSELLLNSSGTYGVAGQSLALVGTGSAGNGGALRQSGSVTWAGNVNLNGNTVITAASSSGTLTLTGTFTDNGYQLQKQGAGNLVLSGSSVMSGSTQVGNGTITVNAVSALGTGDLLMAQTSTNNTAVVLNNAIQSVGNLSSTFVATTGTQTQTITLNGTVLAVHETGTTTFGNNGAVSTLTSSIGGTGSLEKGGTGTLILSGTHTYTGVTTVNAGSLFVSGSLATSQVTVSAGATLGLSGAATGGTSFSALNLNALTLGTGSGLILDLGTGNNDSDSLTLGSLLINGQISLSLVDTTGGNLLAGTTYDLLTLTSGSLTPAELSDFNETGVAGQLSVANNNELQFTVQGVPEPGTWGLIAIGLAMCGVLMVRRRAKA